MRHQRGYGAAGWLSLAVVSMLVAGCSGGSAEPDQAAVPTPTSTPDTASEATTVTLAFAGDVHFAGGLADAPGQDRATLGPMSATLREADVAMVNLETALTRRVAPASKELEDPGNRYWFRTGPAALDLIDRSGVDVVTVANNHGADYGAAGLRDTVRIAEDSPVAVIGAGLDEEQAFTPFRTSVRGTDVAILAADASPRESADTTWAVGPDTGPGIASARGAQAKQLVAAVREAASVDDLVVVYLHWGEEQQACPTGAQEALSSTLSAAGADIVVGTHAHTPLGAGMLGDTYVSYGLGNFFWYHGNQSDTGVLQLSVTGDQVVDDQWVPGRIRPQGGNAQPLRGAAETAAVADWRGLRGCTDLAPGPGASTFPAFTSSVGPAVADEMPSYDAATCPVPLADLRHLTLSYVGFDGRAHTGDLIVAADLVGDVITVFDSLYESRFPIERMRLIDAYGGNDNRSMAANNTSGYNCRLVAGTTSWSDHAYGRAIDIDPVQNPYVMGTRVLPPAGRSFVDVDRSASSAAAPGVIRAGDPVRRAFARIGWTWGGTYADPDYQHFSAP